MLTSIFLVGLGFLLLILGGDLLVRGAVGIAQKAGLSPLVIGLTLVGFGTSTPELVTSVQASLSDAPGIAFGNIVGSNIANILLILGGCALLTELKITQVALRRDGAFMFASALVFSILGATMEMNRLVGASFLVCLVGYIAFVVISERRNSTEAIGAIHDKALALESVEPAVASEPNSNANLLVSILLLILALALVISGGYALVRGAKELALSWGVSEAVIGLTIVAVGTSAPELITSVVAAYKGQGDIAFGNIVGSNIYNILAIGGATALIAPSTVPDSIVRFDSLVMLAACCAVLFFAFTRLTINRIEGALLLLGYLIYLWALWPN